ncbi:efflux RND transporter periplasmic adaptor subunit, partial [Thioclava sp. BHET1]
MTAVRSNWGWGTILSLAGLVTVVLLPAGWAMAETARAATLAPEAPLGVQIITAKLSEDRKTLTLTGEIAARDTLSASFPTSGRITEMRASRGDHVKQGDELARIDSVQQEEGLRSAQATLASAQAALTKARDDASRQDNLLATGATTRSARDSAADDLRAAEATVAQASADLDRAKKALSDTVLLAPADATVTDRMAEVGQVVSAAQPVLELALGNRFDAIFQVPEVSLATAPRTIPVITLWPVGQPDRHFTGMVREISPLVDATQGTVKVKVSVDSLPKGVGFGDAVVGQVSTKD